MQVWNEAMAIDGQARASKCDPVEARGQNYYYNISEVLGALQESLPINRINPNYESSIFQVCGGNRNMIKSRVALSNL